MTQFGNDKTSGILFLEISSIKINKKEKVNDFNHIFLTLFNIIPDKLAEAIQIKFYTSALLPPIAMLAKRKANKTLKDNFMESIKVEKDLAASSNHLGNEEGEASTLEKNGKKNKETELNGKYRLILQLQNEIMNLKASKREGKKTFKKSTNTNTSP